MADETETLLLVPVGRVADADLAALAPALGAEFGLGVRVHPAHVWERDAAFNPQHTQCDAVKLLWGLLAHFHGQPARVVGVTSTDLYTPGLAWVFGLAQMGGRAAIVSTHRLSERFRGRAPDAGPEQRRARIEIGHELGHLFGLYHCDEPGCVMHRSQSAEEIDAKRGGLCDRCATTLQRLRTPEAVRRARRWYWTAVEALEQTATA